MKNKRQKINEKKGLVTKSYLDMILDAKLNKFVTKEELTRQSDRIIKYVNFELEPIHGFMDKFNKFYDDIMIKLDWLIKSYQKNEQADIIMTERNRRIDDKLDDHEKRLVITEKKISQI